MPAPRLSHLVSWAEQARRKEEHAVKPLRNGTLFPSELPGLGWAPEPSRPASPRARCGSAPDGSSYSGWLRSPRHTWSECSLATFSDGLPTTLSR